MYITLRQLRAFTALAGSGSFTAAARALNLTQSTLTKTIAELEAEVSLQFFERTTRRVQLTEDGIAFLPVAQRLLQDYDLTVEDLRQKALGRSGIIKIACGTAFAATVLPAVINRFRQSHPDVIIHLVDDTSGGMLQRLAAGEVDMSLGSMVGDLVETLTAIPVLRARLGVLFPPGAEPPAATIQLTALHSMALIRDGKDTSISTALNARGINMQQNVRGTVVASNLAVQFALIRSGIGACVLSALAASHPSAEGLVFKLIDDTGTYRDIHLFHRKERVLSPTSIAFLKELKATLPTLRLREGISFEF